MASIANSHDALLRGHHSHTSFGLWSHLSRNGLSQAPPPCSTTSSATVHAPPIAPLDKAGASTRILLHDTQAHLEKFIERVTQFTDGIADAKRELVAVQKLYQEDHEQLVERMIGLSALKYSFVPKADGLNACSQPLPDGAPEVDREPRAMFRGS